MEITLHLSPAPETELNNYRDVFPLISICVANHVGFPGILIVERYQPGRYSVSYLLLLAQVFRITLGSDILSLVKVLSYQPRDDLCY